MERQIVSCPNCGRGADAGQRMCMNCGSDLPAPAPAPVRLPPYRCPRCGTPHPPQIVKRLTPGGWVFLIFGILFFLVGALLALLFIEEQRVCPICGVRVS
jgi:RNA polymerase subunit RPABC4/transcription elongation factor Spt4